MKAQCLLEKYKGRAMANVPADYLLWLWDSGKCYMEVKTYIHDNLDALRLEEKRSKEKNVTRISNRNPYDDSDWRNEMLNG